MIYQVVDIKVKLIEREILYKIGQVISLMPEGISQVLFVVDQRLMADEKRLLDKIESFILKIGINKYTTIVRTKFDNFKMHQMCDDDNRYFYKLNISLFKHMNIIHVDNPPTHILKDDDNEIIQINERRRKKSRNILLNYLEDVCLEEYFKLKKWDKLAISKHLKNLEDLENLENTNIENKEIFAKKLKSQLEPSVRKLIKKLTTDDTSGTRSYIPSLCKFM
jgi:hypothetical protein